MLLQNYREWIPGGKRKRQTRKKHRGGSNVKLENVLGVTAAVGYNKNVLPQATALSKNSRSNYLTLSMKNKKFLNHFIGIQPKDVFRYAILMRDAYAAKRLLTDPPREFANAMKDRKKLFSQRYYNEGRGMLETPLDIAVRWLIDLERNSKASAYEKEQVLNIVLMIAEDTPPELAKNIYEYTIYDLSPNSVKKILKLTN